VCARVLQSSASSNPFMGFDAQKLFDAEKQALEVLHHRWARVQKCGVCRSGLRVGEGYGLPQWCCTMFCWLQNRLLPPSAFRAEEKSTAPSSHKAIPFWPPPRSRLEGTEERATELLRAKISGKKYVPKMS
jgi:hypothetical protein